MDQLNALSESIAALAKEASKKLFHVPSPAGGRTALSFDGKNLLVRCYQADEGEELMVLSPEGAEIKAKVKGFDPRLGLAVLELAEALPGSAWKPMAGLPALGSLVLVAAYPSSEGPETRLDAVRLASAGTGGQSYIQTDGTPYPGFSGAALVAPDGTLAGVLVEDGPGNTSYALPASRAQALVAEIAAKGFPGMAWLGLATIPVEAPQSLRQAVGKDLDEALLVTGVVEESPAGKAGIATGDILVSVGGKPLRNPDDLRDAIDAAKPGEPLTLSLFRAGKLLELGAIPEKAPAGSGRERGLRGHGGHHGGHHNGHGWNPEENESGWRGKGMRRMMRHMMRRMRDKGCGEENGNWDCCGDR